MAEVRVCLGRRSYNFAHKTCHRYLTGSEGKRGGSAVRASSLSAGLLSGDNRDGELRGAGHAVDGVTQDYYTRVTPLLNTVCENCCYHIGVNKLSRKPQGQHIGTVLPRYRINATVRRNLCTSRSARRRQSLGSCWGQFVFIRAYSGNGPRSEPLYRTKTGYYEILEVSPTATQVQIKTAYYKQSFIYHPDRNAASEDATVRFSEISEAYTVLGHKALRRKYDRGLLSQSDLIATTRPSAKDTGSSAREPTGSRRSVVAADGRGGVSDFDRFIKSHYNEQLQRDRDIRVRKEEMLRKKQETLEEKKMGRMLEMGVAVLVVMAVAIVGSLKR